MSKTIHRAPLALASDGTILLNIATFDVKKVLDLVYALASDEPGAVFIGIAVNPKERDRLEALLDDAMLQAAFTIVATRQARRRASHNE